MTSENVDDLDRRIINALVDNSKTPLREIAKKLKVSFVTVMNRIKKLEKEGIIMQYTTKVDYEKLGYNIQSIIEVGIMKGRFDEFEKEIKHFPQVCSVYDITGELDAMIIARFKNTKEMSKFLEDIQKYDFVKRTFTKLILYTFKEGEIVL